MPTPKTGGLTIGVGGTYLDIGGRRHRIKPNPTKKPERPDSGESRAVSGTANRDNDTRVSEGQVAPVPRGPTRHQIRSPKQPLLNKFGKFRLSDGSVKNLTTEVRDAVFEVRIEIKLLYSLVGITGMVLLILLIRNFRSIINYLAGFRENCLIMEFSAGNQSQYIEVPGTTMLTHKQTQSIKDVNITLSSTCCAIKLTLDWECSEMCNLPKGLTLGIRHWRIRRLINQSCQVRLYYRVDSRFLVLFCQKNDPLGPRSFVNAITVDQGTSTGDMNMVPITAPLYPSCPPEK
jgi:hypothetical protein